AENGLEPPARLPDWREQWEASETTRGRLAQLGDSLPQSPGGNAVLTLDSLEWVERLPDGAFKRIPAARLRQLIDGTITQTRRPPWMTVRIGDPQGPPLFPGRVDPSTPPLPAAYRGRLQVETRLTDRDRLFASIRRQTTWMIAVAGLAVTTAAAGLWLTQRSLQRERQLNALKSQFVSSVSHELRAPVASMRLMAEALHSGKVTGERAAGEFHRLMAGEGARLSALIENVLDFARIEQGRKTYRKEPADLAALVDDSIKLMQPQAEARAVRLQFANDLKGFTPQIDAQAIQQALVNLLDNAIKHAPKETEVTVQLGRNGARWFLSVQDQGPGIPGSEHERIFQRFTRLGNELRRETQGTGIGLSLVKHIVEGHDGEVQVESAPGSGATFSMRFPGS
ncbi:MAG TPA: HAMP domain-containing sensor histidine kinase, partial [Verrucomicrobiales bacterium]|nr:HAMP domain-containing sensor histidine kinase [Verrucomicrobiales bacterium]